MMRRSLPRKEASRTSTLVASAVLLLGACGQGDSSDQQDVEAVADATRADIDTLAAAVGTDPEVQDDVLTDCEPGDRDSGRTLSYGVRVTVTDDALSRLESEIADRYGAAGWTVKRETGSDRVRFQRGDETIGATIFSDRGFAVVSGSGGCVN